MSREKTKMMKTNLAKVADLEKKIIFIVEDNEVYAKSLQTFLQTHFPQSTEIKLFRVGEMCLMEMHRNPTVVIMDYFLNSTYGEATNGLEIIKRIKALKPQTNIILLTVQTEEDVFLKATSIYDCAYLRKDENVFLKVEQFVNEIFNRKSQATFESLS